MNFALTRFVLHLGFSCEKPMNRKGYGFLLLNPKKRPFSSAAIPLAQKTGEELLVVVGGGAAGVYGAIRAKTVAPHLNVLVIEKGKLLSKVKLSGGGRCNVTNGQCTENLLVVLSSEGSVEWTENSPLLIQNDAFIAFVLKEENNQNYVCLLQTLIGDNTWSCIICILAERYPRGHRELRGSFFSKHGPTDTMTWFSEHGVKLKTEDDGRVFPVSDSSSSIIDCLLSEAKQKGVLIQTGKVVTSASRDVDGNFLVKIEKRTTNYMENLKADYLLIASGSSRQGYVLATQLGHSVVDPVPSLFTFKIEDSWLAELSGVTFPKVRVKLKLENVQTNIPQLTQVGPMLVTHWGLSGPAILRLSAWGARLLFSSDYEGDLFVDFVPDIKMEDVKSILMKQKHRFTKQKLLNACPFEFGIVKRFWKYALDREGVDADTLWASISNNSLIGIASLLKQCKFRVMGKGQFKDEFVTAGGVPLSEISLSTMESKIRPHLFFAGEVLNVDGVTGGFNFQNAWSGGYIAGTSIGKLALDAKMEEEVEHGKTPS